MWAFLLAVTDGPPPDEVTELTACPLTNFVLALKVTDQSESCVWLKDNSVLFDNRNTTYSIKRNESHENFIILFVSEKDSGTYECHIRSRDKSPKHHSTYKLHVRSQEECNTRRHNNSANNFLHFNLADVLNVLFSALGALCGAYLIFYRNLRKNLCRKCHALEKDDSYKVSDITEKDESDVLNKSTSSPVERKPIQVLDGNEREIIELRNYTSNV